MFKHDEISPNLKKKDKERKEKKPNQSESQMVFILWRNWVLTREWTPDPVILVSVRAVSAPRGSCEDLAVRELWVFLGGRWCLECTGEALSFKRRRLKHLRMPRLVPSVLLDFLHGCECLKYSDGKSLVGVTSGSQWSRDEAQSWITVIG